MASTTESYNHVINNNNYTFRVSLVSTAGQKTVVQDIKPSAIKNLNIENKFNEAFHSGFIIIDNSFDIIERDTPNAKLYNDVSYYNNAGVVASDQNSGFLFRGESRDVLRIDIMPILDGTTIDNMGAEDSQKYFRMTFDFAIYNSEETAGDQPDQKFKKLYFWDLYYQLLIEKNVQFSTATIPSLTATQDASNVERGIFTGLALKELLKAALPEEDGYPASFSTNIPGTTDITTINQQAQDENNIDWDIGATNIFFSSPANYKAMDCIEYILSRHVSNADSDYDQCFLRLERWPRQFSLKSAKQYFSQAYNSDDSPGSLYLETVKLGGYTSDDGKTAPGVYTPSKALYFERFGTIKSFSFDNMAGIFSQNFLTSKIVHSYDYQNKQFNIDVLRNGIEQAMKTYEKNYVKKMNSANNDPPFANFAPGQYRYTNKNLEHIFSVVEQDPDQRLAFGKNKFLYASIMSNNLISFRLPGSTHRQAGRFIGIDRDGATPDSKFDNKLLGIYLIIDAKHMFNGSEYYNELHCIKVYNFNQLDNTYGETSDNTDTSLQGLISKGY